MNGANLPFWKPAQKDVFSHAKSWEETQLLVDHTDSQISGMPGAHRFNLLAADKDLPSIFGQGRAYDLHQSRFACPIFSDQAVYFPFVKIKGNTMQYLNAGKRFIDVLQLENRCSFGHVVSLSVNGVLECWSVGVLECCKSPITPLLHYPITPLLHG